MYNKGSTVKLKLIREHYSKNIGNTWVPKKSFKTLDEIEKEVGFDPEKCLTYTCSVCGNLHMHSPNWKYENVS